MTTREVLSTEFAIDPMLGEARIIRCDNGDTFIVDNKVWLADRGNVFTYLTAIGCRITAVAVDTYTLNRLLLGLSKKIRPYVEIADPYSDEVFREYQCR
jgi:hypothetical protein